MANQLLAINEVTREAVRLWKNTNAFLMSIDRQYDDSFANSGAKIGTALRIRLPNDYVIRRGQTAQVQDTGEPSTTLVVSSQAGVDISFSSVDRAMTIDDYSRRVVAPAINTIAGGVAADIMSGVEGGICNVVANVDGSNNVLNPVASTFLQAGAILDTQSAPSTNRKVVNDPFTEARVVATLSGLFNPSSKISAQFMTGHMKEALGFDWMKDQTVIKHTNGTYSTGTVNGAGQVGNVLQVNAIAGALAAGDIVTIAGVNGVNRVNKQTTGQLRQFVITAAAPVGSTSLSIYPALVPGSTTYNPVTGANAAQYQTVTASPANSATILPVLNASATYRKSFVFCPEAVTMATADLEIPRGVHEAHRESFDDLSIRMVSGYMIGTDQFISRLDVLWGYLWVRPEWAVVVADAI